MSSITLPTPEFIANLVQPYLETQKQGLAFSIGVSDGMGRSRFFLKAMCRINSGKIYC